MFYVAEYSEAGLTRIIGTYQSEKEAMAVLMETDNTHGFSIEPNPFSYGKLTEWVASGIWPDADDFYSIGATPEEVMADYMENWK